MLTTLLNQEQRQRPLTWSEDRKVDCTIAQWLSQLLSSHTQNPSVWDPQCRTEEHELDPETALAYWSNWKYKYFMWCRWRWPMLVAVKHSHPEIILHFEELFFCSFSVEVSFLWASHQVHHSSEYYNLTTALRQSLTQQFTSWVSRYSIFILSLIFKLIFNAHLSIFLSLYSKIDLEFD